MFRDMTDGHCLEEIIEKYDVTVYEGELEQD
jgi:hypothetical protein